MAPKSDAVVEVTEVFAGVVTPSVFDTVFLIYPPRL